MPPICSVRESPRGRIAGMEQKPRNRRFRFALSAMLVAAVVLAVVVAALVYQSGRRHSFRYRRPGDPMAFKEAVRRGVHGGQSVDEVVSLLGPGIPEDRSRMLRDLAVKVPALYRDGF